MCKFPLFNEKLYFGLLSKSSVSAHIKDILGYDCEISYKIFNNN